MVRILAVSDEEDRSLTVPRLREINPNIVVSCGDLGPDYLDLVSSAANAPLLYVPGNHDPDQRPIRGESEWTVRQPNEDELITNVPRRPGGSTSMARSERITGCASPAWAVRSATDRGPTSTPSGR